MASAVCVLLCKWEILDRKFLNIKAGKSMLKKFYLMVNMVSEIWYAYVPNHKYFATLTFSVFEFSFTVCETCKRHQTFK